MNSRSEKIIQVAFLNLAIILFLTTNTSAESNTDGNNGKILHRHRRDTNSSSSGAFFDDPNNAAMYLVLPLIVFVYGGCACIYCCYKCREYIEEKQPLTVIRLKLQGKSMEEIREIRNRNKIEEPRTQHIFTESRERPSSVKSLPESSRTFDDIDYIDRQRSVLSTPGFAYSELRSKSDINHPFTTHSSVANYIPSPTLSGDTDRLDSGIQEDQDRLYTSNSSRCHSGGSLDSDSFKSEIITAAYTNSPDENHNDPFAWLGINEVVQNNLPPNGTEYKSPIRNVATTDTSMQTEDSAAKKKKTPRKVTNINATGIPPKFPNLINVSKTDHWETSRQPKLVSKVEKNKAKIQAVNSFSDINRTSSIELQSQSESFDSEYEQKKMELYISNQRKSSFSSKNNANKQQSKSENDATPHNTNAGNDFQSFDSDYEQKKMELYIKNQGKATFSSLNGTNNIESQTQSSKTMQNTISGPQGNEPHITKNKQKINALTEFSNITNTGNAQAHAQIRKPKPKLGSEISTIDYKDEKPQINGRFRMYYQSKKIIQSMSFGDQSRSTAKAVPTISGSISNQTGNEQVAAENKKVKPIFVGINSGGDLEITNKKRPKITNVKQLMFPY